MPANIATEVQHKAIDFACGDPKTPTDDLGE
jgi:hypothetical protein